jgi:hypothetical protein
MRQGGQNTLFPLKSRLCVSTRVSLLIEQGWIMSTIGACAFKRGKSCDLDSGVGLCIYMTFSEAWVA